MTARGRVMSIFTFLITPKILSHSHSNRNISPWVPIIVSKIVSISLSAKSTSSWLHQVALRWRTFQTLTNTQELGLLTKVVWHGCLKHIGWPKSVRPMLPNWNMFGGSSSGCYPSVGSYPILLGHTDNPHAHLQRLVMRDRVRHKYTLIMSWGWISHISDLIQSI
jgi:hypothetical protein